MSPAEFISLKPFIDGWSILIFLGVIQGFFLAINCFSMGQRDRLAHNLLGWLLVSISLTVVEVLLCYTGYIVYVPFLVGFSEPLNFVFPPLLYFYTQTRINPEFRWKVHYNWAFLPAMLLLLYMIPFFAQSNVWLLQTVAIAYHKTDRVDRIFRDYGWASSYTVFYAFFKYVLVSYQIGYLFIILRVIHTFKQKGRVFPISVQWVNQISWSFLLVFIVYALLTWYYQSDVGDVYVATCVSIVFFGMSFRLITQSKILDNQPVNDNLPIPPRAKYEKTALREDTSIQTLNRLLSHLEQEKPYRRNDITLPELAAQLTTATHHLSQVINQHCQQNFFDLINSYRIREIQQKLVDPQYSHVKIEAIALDSGFNSKSAFNAAFKKVTSQTPSQFRKINGIKVS